MKKIDLNIFFLSNMFFFCAYGKLQLTNERKDSKLELNEAEKEFYDGMNADSKDFITKYMHNEQNKKKLDILKDLYIKNNLKAIQRSETLKIPKIIHQIWVGPEPIPKFFEVFRKSWIEKHPSWQYKLWTNKEVEELNLVNRRLYNKASLPREKANILRYELLYQFGGLYVDGDFLCLTSFDDLNHCYDFYVGISANDTKTIINNALIGSIPRHQIMKHIVENIKNGIKDPINRSGTWYFSRELTKIMKRASGTNIAFPMNFFYCVPKNNDSFKSREALFKFIKPQSMALHYWASFWDKEIEKLIISLSEENINNVLDY